MLKFNVTARGLIIHEGKLLICRLRSHDTFYCLPGGKLDVGESIEQTMIREMVEESGIKPEVGNLLFINQLINSTHHRIEFFYHIRNSQDYLDANLNEATHANEIAEWKLADIRNDEYDLRPSFLVKLADSYLDDPDNTIMKIIQSD
ncbi:MAG: NUDIX domain-containing protein [Candidatus Saccharibacteria bacterium]